MAQKLTIEDARESMSVHVANKGEELYAKYGPQITWKTLLAILQDRAFVRYPCEIVFDASPLLPGEFAHPVARGERPEDGFDMHVHPAFMLDLDRVPWLVLYQLVLVNYGAFASSDDAELFGANALGLPREAYYQALCELADQVPGASCAG